MAVMATTSTPAPLATATTIFRRFFLLLFLDFFYLGFGFFHFFRLFDFDWLFNLLWFFHNLNNDGRYDFLDHWYFHLDRWNKRRDNRNFNGYFDWYFNWCFDINFNSWLRHLFRYKRDNWNFDCRLNFRHSFDLDLDLWLFLDDWSHSNLHSRFILDRKNSNLHELLSAGSIECLNILIIADADVIAVGIAIGDLKVAG